MEEIDFMTLKEYLDDENTLPENIEDFIELDIAGVEYNIEDLFVKRNYYKKLGSPTADLFKHNLDVLIDEALAKFNPQLRLLQDNFTKLMDRKVAEMSSGNATDETHGTNTGTDTTVHSGTDNLTNKNYLNPANTDATKLSEKTDVDETKNLTDATTLNLANSSTKTKTFSESKDRTFAWLKTNPEIIQSANKCFEVVTDILRYLDRAFLSEY